GIAAISAAATILCCGGASWPRLGSDGAWRERLLAAGVEVTPLLPSNMGARIGWSAHMKERFAGAPLKRVALRLGDRTVRGELVITEDGLEGGALYALSRLLRECVAAGRTPALFCDLRPDLDIDAISARLARARPKDSLANRLRRAA